jgi:glycosyltransferase involved in cell wall biosynthesis
MKLLPLQRRLRLEVQTIMRLAIIVSHPIQYYSPWFRHIAQAIGQVAGGEGLAARGERRVESGEVPQSPEIRDQNSEVSDQNPLKASGNSQRNALRVFYLWDFGVTEKTDKGFGQTVKWDVDLLEGYDHEFVPNVSKRPGTDWFGGLDNPDLLQRVKAFAPDVILQFGYNYNSLVNFDLRWKTKRTPLMFRGDSHLLAEDGEQSVQRSVFSSQRERIKRWVRQLGLRLLFKRFACFLAVGKANADYFRAHGVPESKIVRCPHVVDNAFFLGKNASGQSSVGSSEQDEQGRGLRRQLGIPEDDLVFLFAGKLEEKKQPLLLLEAFSRADLPRATLLFVGSGALESALKEQARECVNGVSVKQCFGKAPDTEKPEYRKTEPPVAGHSAKRVVFMPFQNQSRMPEVYRTGDVLVLPSRGRYETWGLAVNEAACCGLPAIVSSHVGCGPDLIENGVTGWTFDAGDMLALRRVLKQAAARPSDLPRMGDVLRRRVQEEFGYAKATEILLSAAAATAARCQSSL